MTCQILIVGQNEAHHVHGFQMMHDFQSDFSRNPEKWEQCRNPGSGLNVFDANSRKSRRQAAGLEEGIIREGKVDERLRRKQIDDVQYELSRQQVERMLWPDSLHMRQGLIAVVRSEGLSFWMSVVRGHVVVLE